MRLEAVCETFDASRFPRIGDEAHPDREAILRVRGEIRDALATDEFLIDCISHELRHIEHDRIGSGLSPFFTIPGLGVRFAFGYWRPGRSAPPHEHTAWTVTAVCRNQLDVTTYDRAESYRRGELVEKNVFKADAGKVGFIYEPAIHAPRNPSAAWTLSLHVISPRDGQPLAGVTPLAELAPQPPSDMHLQRARHPSAEVFRARNRYRELGLLARTLLSTGLPQAAEPLAKCFEIGPSAVRRQLARAMPERFSVDESRRWLARTARDLSLLLVREERASGLFVATPTGLRKALDVNHLAHDALAFAVAHARFEVRALPGTLSEEERTAIGDMLEATGTFKRMDA